MDFTKIPDNIFKILVLIGGILIYFSWNGLNNVDSDIESKYQTYISLQDSLDEYIVKLEIQKQLLLNESEDISFKYNVETMISEKDSSLIFNKKYSGTNNETIVRDILTPIWNEYSKKNREIKIIKVRAENMHDEYARILKEKEPLVNVYYIAISVGFILLVLSLLEIWLSNDSINLKDKYEIREKGPATKWCQSCLRNFNSIVIPGTNRNGSINYSYCNDCFNLGEFVLEDDLKKKEILLDINSKKYNWFTKKILNNRFEMSDRWKINKYF